MMLTEKAMIDRSEQQKLSYLGFQMLPPSPQLAHIVRCYWLVQFDGRGHRPALEYLYSKGDTGITFNFADAPQINGELINSPALFDGTMGKAKSFSVFGKIHTLGVRFQPGGAYLLTGIPLHELSHSTHSLDALNLREGDRLHSRLEHCKNTADRIQKLEQWLTVCVGQSSRLQDTTLTALNLLQKSSGDLRIADLCDSSGFGKRKLERSFRKEIGITAKHYARILRVEKARLLLKQASSRNLAEVGYDAGFYDQPHFNQEFKNLIGITPKRYQERSRERVRESLIKSSTFPAL